MTERSTSVRLRAEVDQYIRDMQRAGQATSALGQAGTKTGVQLARAQKQQVDSAMSVRIAEERLKETRAQSNASASQILSAEQNLARAKDQSSQATAAATRAEAAHTAAAQQSSTAMGRLAASARDNRDAWTQASVPLLAVGTGVTAMGAAALRTGIQYNTLQQTTRAALTTLTGSAAEASAQMDKLDAFARNSPFAKQTFIQAQQQLLGFGMEADKVLPTLDAIQNAVAAFGGSNQQISEIAFIMAQIQAAGKITAVDLMQLGQRGVDAATLIGSQMGMTGAQIRESITAGSLSAGDALDALTAGMDQRFGGAAENVKNTFAGAMDRVMAAWRDLSSELAAPLVGPEGGGLFTGLLNETADLMRDFQELPGPVKTGTAALTGVSGAAALVSGGFLLLAPRIVETRAAMAVLAADMPKTSRALSGVSKAAGVAAAALVAYQAAGALASDFDVAGTNEFANALSGVSGSLDRLASAEATELPGWLFGLPGMLLPGFGTVSRELNGVKDAFDQLDASTFGRGFDKLTPWEDGFDKASKAVNQMDAALAGFVQSGSLEQAEEGFQKLVDTTGRSEQDLLEKLPQYRDALAALEGEQAAAGESAGAMGEGMDSAAANAEAAAEALEKAREASQQMAAAFLDVDAKLGEGRGIRDWLKELENGVKAQERFTENFSKLAMSGASDDLLSYIQEQGPEAAELLDQLANGSQEFRDRANAAFEAGAGGAQDMGKAGADLLAILDQIPDTVQTELRQLGGDELTQRLADLHDQYDLTPDEITTLMKAMDLSSDQIKAVQTLLGRLDGSEARPRISVSGADAASSAIRSVQGLLNSLPFTRNIRITTTRSGDDVGNAARAPSANGSLYVGSVKTRAAGGFDEYGRAVPRLPQLRNGNQGTVMWAEPETGWEAYISGKPGMEARNRGILADAAERLGMAVTPLDLGKITAFADGGRLDRLNAQRRVRDLQRDLAEKERYGSKPKSGQPDRRPRRYVLRGLDREIAREELKEARRELSDLRRPASQRRAAREQRSEDVARGRADFMSNADLSEAQLRSPAAVERALQRSISDMATFTMLLIELKKKGASPWLLGQLQGFGPSKSTIRYARMMLADNAKLRSTNALAAQAQEVSRVYGTVTTDSRWEANKAWSSPVYASTERNLERTTNVNVQFDGDYLAREVARYVRHELSTINGGMVLPG